MLFNNSIVDTRSFVQNANGRNPDVVKKIAAEIKVLIQEGVWLCQLNVLLV